MFLNLVRIAVVAILFLAGRTAAAEEPSPLSVSVALDVSLVLPGAQVAVRQKNVELAVGANWLMVFTSVDAGVKVLWPTTGALAPYVYARVGRFYMDDVDNHTDYTTLSGGVGGEWRFGPARAGFLFGEVGYQHGFPDPSYSNELEFVDLRAGVGRRF
jgi:hypothetical protein